MANFEKDNIPMLSEARKQSDELADSRSRSFDFRARTRSASMSISMDSYDGQNYVGYTGPLRSERKIPLVQMSGPLLAGRRTDNVFQPTQDMSVLDVPDPSTADSYPTSKKNDQNYWLGDIDNDGRENDHLMKSGQLGVCNDPYCTTCPSYYNFQEKQQRNPRASGIFDPKFHNILYGDAKGCARGFLSFLHSHIPGVMNPHAKIVQRWNKFFVICSLVSIFVDPLFFFLLIVQQDANCIAIDWSMTTMIVIFRSITDFIYFLHILLQFRLAYVAPESRVVGAGDLIAHPKKIAINYLTGYFFLDVFIVLPLPQVCFLSRAIRLHTAKSIRINFIFGHGSWSLFNPCIREEGVHVLGSYMYMIYIFQSTIHLLFLVVFYQKLSLSERSTDFEFAYSKYI